MSILQSLRRMLRRNTDLNDELQTHLRMAVADRVARGESPEEARQSVLREFGSVPLVADVTREQWAGLWMHSLLADVRFGLRQLWKRKMMTVAAMVSLGLAIGSCVAAFQLIDALFLRPLPAVSDPGSLYALTYSRKPTEYLPASSDTNSYPFFEHARGVVKSKAELAAASVIGQFDVTYGTDAEMEKAHQQSVSGNLFSMLGVRPELGRLLTENDDRVERGSPYAVISYDYWQARFARDPKVIGRTLRMDDGVYTIVGVAPKGFTGTEPGTVTDIFVPAKMKPSFLYSNVLPYRVFVRVPRDLSEKALGDELNAAYQHWENVRLKDFPKNLLSPNATLSLKPAASGASLMQTDYALALKVLGVLVALVLLIACANVANLMSAQGAARAREMAVRTSLGAGRARLARLVLVESAMLGILTGALGLVFALWAAPYVVSQINPPDDPARLLLGLDWRIASFAVLLTVAVTMLFGMIPALRASVIRPVSALKGGEEPHGKAVWMQSMIALQVMFCFVVLFVAGLFVMTEVRLVSRPMGFVPQRLLLLYTDATTEQPAVKWDQMATTLRNVPGVQQTALEDWPLLSENQRNFQISLHGEPPGPAIALFLAVSPGWLDTMRIPLLDGRDFRDSDSTPNVALVNQAFEKAFFGGKNSVGQSFQVARPFHGPGWHPNTQYGAVFDRDIIIIGVVKDVLYRNVREQITPQVYLPNHRLSAVAGTPADTLQKLDDEVIVVRTSSDNVNQMAAVLPRVVKQTDPEFRVSEVMTQAELISDQTIRERLLATLAGFFAAVALLLAAIGLYGVLHYSVVQRKREIGIRIALGAAAANIARIVSARMLLPVLAGAAVGMAAAMGSVRFVHSLLYGISGTAISAVVTPMIVLLAAAACATVPAVLRAIRIDPVIMLRAE
jgi:putative ABC transport system permease protein